MGKITTVIVENDIHNANTLTELLESYCKDYIELSACVNNIAEAITTINRIKPKLLFLDIMLDDGTCFDILEKIEYNSFKIIFVTAHSQFAIRAIKFQALDYILKPISIDELVSAVTKALEEINEKNYSTQLQIEYLKKNLSQKNDNEMQLLALPSLNEIDLVKLDDIIYCKSEGRYTIFNIIDKREIVVSKNLGEYETILPDFFCRVHNSYIVNTNKIVKIQKTGGVYCKMENGKLIPVSKRKQVALFHQMKL